MDPNKQAKLRHINNGRCPKCEQLFNLYPGFHHDLRQWFFSLQATHPDAHISCAGRGRVLQDLYFKQGTSRARYGQSAHNYNVALDIFRQTLNGAEYGPTWFKAVVGQAVEDHNTKQKQNLGAPGGFALKWYGDPDSKFYELPHVEVDGWRANIQTLRLVEKA